MKDNNHITEEVLVRYVLGEASPEERTAVLEWISISRSNKDRVEELKLIWRESGKLGLTPSITTEAAWERFTQRTINKREAYREHIQIRPLGWLKAAAVLLLLAGGGWLSWLALQKTEGEKITATPLTKTTVETTTGIASNTTTEPEHTTTTYPVDTEHARQKEAPKVALQSKKPLPSAIKKAAHQLHNYTRTKEFICNATPCPLEICIVQTIHCNDGKPASIATCNILQPDQAGQLHYKAFDKAPRNCKTTVSEIRIKRVTTGETIVLNNDSKPSTAQELFNYLTGQRTTNDDILAGIFETDCDNSCTESKLKIGNNFGHLTLQ
jgi:hypothetical protein